MASDPKIYHWKIEIRLTADVVHEKAITTDTNYLPLGEHTINTINRKKTLEKEKEEERPIVQTLFIVSFT